MKNVLAILALSIVACSGSPETGVQLLPPSDGGAGGESASSDSSTASDSSSSDSSTASDSSSSGDGGGGPCVPKDKVSACGSKDCGSAWDGCTGAIDCGSCTLPQVCGGGGVPGQCGCTQVTKIVACTGRNCGPVSDACGGTYSCGTCSLPESCEGQTPVIAGVCGCTPKLPVAVCGSKECGTAPDGCGGTVSCGTCGGSEICNVLSPDHCDLCPNDVGLLTVGQVCPVGHPVPRQCPSTAYVLPDCVATFFISGITPVGQYCCTL